MASPTVPMFEGTSLTRHGHAATTVFDLLGHDEDGLTAALAWTMAHSTWLVGNIASAVHAPIDPSTATVTVAGAPAALVITTPTAKTVITATRGWLVPDRDPLTGYEHHLDGVTDTMLVCISESTPGWARTVLPDTRDQLPVKHLSWDALRHTIRETRTRTRGRENLWLEQLEAYMAAAPSMVPAADQWVFCVGVTDGPRSVKEHVVRERVYFHPFGGATSWPTTPPNLLAFRWDGQVRQVNRVKRAEVVASLTSRWPELDLPESEDGPHVLYDLGPDILLPQISTDGTGPTARVWTLLDQLLVHPTLVDAARASRDLTARR